MRRIFWTVGMSVIGVFLALKGQDIRLNVKEVAAGGIWAGCIGYGFGSIFDQRISGAQLIFYWAITLALIGLFFGPLLPIGSFLVRQVLGALIAGLAGVLIGTLQLRRIRRKLNSPIANAVG
jgi:drug/metabolite transporter (DMT)-like permease